MLAKAVASWRRQSSASGVGTACGQTCLPSPAHDHLQAEIPLRLSRTAQTIPGNWITVPYGLA
jgi:hypothetical protein